MKGMTTFVSEVGAIRTTCTLSGDRVAEWCEVPLADADDVRRMVNTSPSLNSIEVDIDRVEDELVLVAGATHRFTRPITIDGTLWEAYTATERTVPVARIPRPVICRVVPSGQSITPAVAFSDDLVRIGGCTGAPGVSITGKVLACGRRDPVVHFPTDLSVPRGGAVSVAATVEYYTRGLHPIDPTTLTLQSTVASAHVVTFASIRCDSVVGTEPFGPCPCLRTCTSGRYPGGWCFARPFSAWVRTDEKMVFGGDCGSVAVDGGRVRVTCCGGSREIDLDGLGWVFLYSDGFGVRPCDGSPVVVRGRLFDPTSYSEELALDAIQYLSRTVDASYDVVRFDVRVANVWPGNVAFAEGTLVVDGKATRTLNVYSDGSGRGLGLDIDSRIAFGLS